VVLRLFDADLAERVVRAFEIPISGSPAALAVPVFAAAAEDDRIIATISIGLPSLIVAWVPWSPTASSTERPSPSWRPAVTAAH
jgi:hypothetical protein